jgi:GTPase SAR1 family protein
MRDLLQQLIVRQHATLRASVDGAMDNAIDATDSDHLNLNRQHLISLVLAEAALTKAATDFPDHPPQIVVVGPTQAGKSSVTNMLIGDVQADASPMAGYTVHCQGFYLTSDESAGNEHNWLARIFTGQSQQSQAALDRDRLSNFSLSTLHKADAVLTGNVVWDTPDFDSVDSLSYSEPVLRAIALADVVVLVVSKEKYADKSVWNLLRLLRDLQVPVVPVMNRTDPSVRAELAESFQQKYQRIDADADDMALRFIDDYASQPELAFNSVEVRGLQSDIAAVVTQSGAHRNSETLTRAAHSFIRMHWHDWTASINAEHRLRELWQSDVDLVCDEIIDLYQREYLQHDRYKETFQLALAELLTLLEIPGIAEPITRIRGMVTWPVRKLRSVAEARQRDSDVEQDDRSEERRLLEELGAHAFTRLASRCAERQSADDYWSAVSDNLAQRQPDLTAGYHRALDSYQIMLRGEVECAAQSLYKKLEEQPATLNKLRAARVTADAAAIVLAVKSGGLGAVDLVVAPAMLSLTTMLTEGALGKYMDSVQNDLRSYQQREMAALVQKRLRVKLKSVAADLDRVNDHYISEKQLVESARQLGIQTDKATDATMDAVADTQAVQK